MGRLINITVVNLPQNKYEIKCPYYMTPKGICIHNTANSATAMAEISYMQTNNNYVSFHYAVDETRAVQGLPLTRNAFHAGDGSTGDGNRNYIAIEGCRSTGPDEATFLAAEENMAKLTAELLVDYGWDISHVKKHQDFSGKYCPHHTLDLGWDRFIAKVTHYRNQLLGTASDPTPDTPSVTPTPETPSSSTKYSVGTVVCTNKLATSSTGGKVYDGDWSGTITRVIAGTAYPYLLDGGKGWTNDTGIDSDPHTPGGSSSNTATSTPKPAPSTAKYKVGTPVCTNKLATSSTGGTVYDGDWSGTITRVITGAAYPYLLNDGLGWTNDTGIDSDPHTPGGSSKPASTPKPAPSTTTAKYKVGTPVCTNTLATSSTGGKVYSGDWKGTITRVIAGAAYPYLLNNGLGWTNDKGIDTDPHTPY